MPDDDPPKQNGSKTSVHDVPRDSDAEHGAPDRGRKPKSDDDTIAELGDELGGPA
jgi:hypothetical protein